MLHVQRPDDSARKPYNLNMNTSHKQQPSVAALYDHLLVGDDFFMAVATAELGIKYARRT